MPITTYPVSLPAVSNFFCFLVGFYAGGREGYEKFVPVDAVYALPVPLVEQLGLKSEMREARPLPLGPT